MTNGRNAMHVNRRIGPIGTVIRLLVAAGLLYLAFFDRTSWGLEWYDAAVGLGLLPAASIAFGLGARRYASGPVRFTGSAGTTANCLLLVGLGVNPTRRVAPRSSTARRCSSQRGALCPAVRGP